MIDKTAFHVLNYVKKSEYIGSMDGMRYMLKKVDDQIEVTIWPEPYGYAHTSKELMTVHSFELSEAGVAQIADYLNEQLVAQKALWELGRSHM